MSTNGQTWCIRSAGVFTDRLHEDAVLRQFSEFLGITEETAKPFLEKGRMIQKDLSKSSALSCKAKLEELGLKIQIYNLLADLPADQVPKPSIHLPKVEHPLTCPKCQLGQELTEACIGCGERIDSVILESHVGHTPEEKTTDTIVDSALADSSRQTVPLQTIGAAVGATLIFAFAWQLMPI